MRWMYTDEHHLLVFITARIAEVFVTPPETVIAMTNAPHPTVLELRCRQRVRCYEVLGSAALAKIEFVPYPRSYLGVLTVTFCRGAVYYYHTVPDVLLEQLVDAPSQGRFFNTWIRRKFPVTTSADAFHPTQIEAPWLPRTHSPLPLPPLLNAIQAK